MKGKKKLILPLLLAGATVATGYVAPVYQSVSAATTNGYDDTTSIVGEQVQVEGFDDTYKVGDPVFLPRITTGSDKVDFKVTKGGKQIEIKTATEQINGHDVGEKYFEAKYEGYYNIEIFSNSENSVKTTIENVSVWVEKSEASIVLPVNSKYVIPAKMQKNQEGFKIPAPSVLIGDDEEATDVKHLPAGTDFKVVVYKPNGTSFDTTRNEEGNYYEVDKTNLDVTGTYTIVYEYYEGTTVVASLDTNFQVVNEYDTSKVKLTMTLLDSMPTSGNVNTEVKIPKVKVTESKTSLDAINAHVDVVITNTTTNERYDMTKFDYENYSFVPEKNGNYTVTYKASIDLFGLTSSEVTPGSVITISDKQGATVRPTYDYEVSGTDANEIIKVNGSAVTAEDTDDIDEIIDAKLENIEHLIPSVVKLNGTGTDKKATIILPAIYGTDNLDKLSEITFTRSYKYTENGSTTTIDAPDNMCATVEFTKAGKYEIRYKAVDRKGNSTGSNGYRTYTVIVKDADADLTDGKTKINLNVPYKTISDKDKTLTFAVPTATDTYDEDVEVKTFYNVKGASGNLNPEPIELTDDDKNTSGKYAIDIKKLLNNYSTATSIEVYAEAYVDGALIGTRDAFAEDSVTTGSVTVQVKNSKAADVNPEPKEIKYIVVKSDVKTISLSNSTSDHTPATIAVDGTSWNEALYNANKDDIDMFEDATGKETQGINEYGFAVNDGNVLKLDELNQSAFNQGSDVIKLPKVKIADKDSNLTISVTIKNLYGNVVSKYTSEKITKTETSVGSGEYVYTIDNLSFRLSNYGVYTITYVAKDIGGNITAQTFGVRVNNKTKPTLTIDDKDQFGSEIEVGKRFEVPTPNVIRDGEEVENSQIEYVTWDIESANKYEKIGETAFVPMEAGSFKVIYRAKVRGVDEVTTLGNSTFTLTAKDTTAPEIRLSDNTFIPAKSWEPETGEDYQIIQIPSAFADDGYFKDEANYGYGKSIDVVYSVSGPSSTTPEVTAVDGDMSKMQFKASKQGIYTIKYTATDDSGNTSTITKELKLGDCEAPELTWDNEEKDIPTTAKLNEKLSINLGKITLTDNETDAETLGENLTVTLTDPSGNTVSKISSAVNPEWEITSTGNYTLKFVVKDEVGNTNTYSYKINVPAEEVEEEKISPVVGTILVVVAVAVLAGVVVYFVVSSKKKPTAGKKSSRKAKK